MFLGAESPVVTIERQGSQLKITCVNADAGNESNDLETLHWYKDDELIVTYEESTKTAVMEKEVGVNFILLLYKHFFTYTIQIKLFKQILNRSKCNPRLMFTKLYWQSSCACLFIVV